MKDNHKKMSGWTQIINVVRFSPSKRTKYCKKRCVPKFIDIISSGIGLWTLTRLEVMLGCKVHGTGTLVRVNSSILQTNFPCEISE